MSELAWLTCAVTLQVVLVVTWAAGMDILLAHPQKQSITLNTGAWEKQLKDARQRARELERAAIVAWLRGDKGPIRRVDADGDTLYRSWEGPDFADVIERGAHLLGDGV